MFFMQNNEKTYVIIVIILDMYMRYIQNGEDFYVFAIYLAFLAESLPQSYFFTLCNFHYILSMLINYNQ